MSDTGMQLITPMGRLVWGNPEKPRDKIKDGQKVLNDQGQPIKQWSFGIAIPKAEFLQSVWPVLAAEAATLYTQGVPATFKYKYKDGDDAAPTWNNGKQGTPLNQRDGHAGHFILSIQTELQAPNIVRFENNAYMQLPPNTIKTGDYIMLDLNVKAHAGQTPGLYINPNLVLFCYSGPAISGQYDADPTQSFGAAPALPPPPPDAAPLGAPPAGGPPAMPGMPGAAPPPPVTAPPPPPPPPAGPQRPTDPTHIHNNGNGTEQWLVNGAWDGGAHPIQATMPPPATDFIPGAPAMPGPGNVPQMPPATGMPGQMPPR